MEDNADGVDQKYVERRKKFLKEEVDDCKVK
jgi:hypothetical protein